MSPLDIYELDYIDPESRRRAQAVAQQWQQVAETSRNETRTAQIAFICKIYAIGMSLVTVSALQWCIITIDKRAVKLVKKYNFVNLVLIFINFVMMLLMQNILHSDKSRSKTTVALYIFLTMEITSATLSRPVAESSNRHVIYAAALTLFVVGISLGIALIYHLEMERDQEFLTMWTIKYFLITSICLLMTLTFDNAYVESTITLILLFFISIFVVIWGRSLGSFKFHREESSYISFYITLAYLIFLSLFANALVFLQKI